MKHLNPIHRNDAQNQVAATEETTAAVNATNNTLREVSADKATSQDIQGVVEAVKSIPKTEIPDMTGKFDEVVSAVKSIPPPEKKPPTVIQFVVEDSEALTIKGKDGKPGKDADETKIVQEIIKKVPELVKPLIPEPIPGKDGKDGKGSKGDRGLKGEPGPAGKDGIGVNGKDGKDGSPDTGEQIVDKLNPLKNSLNFEVLTNIPDFALARDVVGYNGGAGGGGPSITFQDEGTTITQNPILKLNVVGAGGSIAYSGSGVATLTLSGGGATTFTSLTDVPNSYVGQGGKAVRVNVGETALEFFAAAGSGTVTSVGSADGSVTIANATTTPDLTVVKITVIDAGGDTTTFPMLATSATGVLAPATDAGLSYNATTNVLTATGGFVGDLTGNVTGNLTGNVTGNADTATNVAVGGITGLGANVATFLATPSSANLASAVTGETGTGALVFGTSPTFTTSINGSYLTASEILITDGSKNIVSAAVATYPSLTELTYVKGVTSAIQTQLTARALAATTITIAGTANQITSSAGAQDLSANRTWTLSLPADVLIPTVLTVPNTGLHLLDTNASHDLIIKPGSNITADRTFTITTGDTDMIVDFTAVTDEFILAYDTGTNTWRGVANAGGSGASTALDNLASVAINAALVLGTSDAFALGSATKQWSDLFLAEGGVINWDNGDVTLTQTGNNLTIAGGDFVVGDQITATDFLLSSGGSAADPSIRTTGDPELGIYFTGTTIVGLAAGGATLGEISASFWRVVPNLLPFTTDTATLGSTTKQWGDLFLSEGGVINWDNGDATITQTADDITFAGITTFGVGTSTAVTLGTLELGAASDTTLARVSAGVVSIEGVTIATSSNTLTFTNKTMTASSNVLGGVTMTLGSDADGDIYYRASNVLTRLAKGTGLQALRMNAGATAPEWATAGTGDFVGPSSSTDNAVVRFDGTTGKLGQDSIVTIGDTGAVAWTVANTSNVIALTVTQNDTTNSKTAVKFVSAVLQDATTGLEEMFVLEGTTAGAAGPFTAYYFNSASPASLDYMGTNYYFNDSGANKTFGGGYSFEIFDPTDGSEDTDFYFRTMLAGTNAVRFYIGATFSAQINGIGVGASTAAGIVSSNGNQDLILRTDNATTGSITIANGANGIISLTPNGTGAVAVSTTLELGAATDTTLARVSAGVISVEGKTVAMLPTTQTFTGINTFTPTARTSGSASYFTITAPADTGITTTAESKGINIVGATRTWADGTVTTQREYFFGAPTYNKTTTSATFTTAATVYIEGNPTAGTGVTISQPYGLWVNGNALFGTSLPFAGENTPFGVDIWGDNNTTAGIQAGVGNRNSGTSAYSGFYLNNDLAVSGDVTHFAFLALNSSTYTDSTFGTALAVANQFSIQNTDGPITFIANKNSSQYHSFIIGGTAVANEVGRFTSTGLTVGLTGTLTGAIKFAGATSTSITLQGQAVGSSGVLTLPAATDTLVGKATTDTLTNKRRTRRVITTTQSATPTINTDNTDVSSITALAQAITSMTTNLSGTPVAGDLLEIQFTDDGTGRAITWGASFASSGNVSLPTTTVAGVMLRVGLEWNTVTSKWTCVAVA